MTKIDYKNKKAVTVAMVKLLKSDDFFNHLEEFDLLLTKGEIDINQIIDNKRGTTFLDYTINHYEKFFYLVDKYQANYHHEISIDGLKTTQAIRLLYEIKTLGQNFSSFDNTYQEEKKIFERIKNDKYTWFDEKITSKASEGGEIKINKT